MTSPTNSIIPDADVIINLHEMQIWPQFVANNDVYVGGIVAGEAAFYYTVVQGVPRRYPTSIANDISSSLIQLLSLDASDLMPLSKQLTEMKREIEVGELETIAIVYHGKVDDISICLIDRAAIFSAVLLGLKNSCISVEAALARCGLQRSVPQSLSTARFERIIKEADIERTYHLSA